MDVTKNKSDLVLKILLLCGVVASILYLATDIVTATFLYPGYDYTSQQVSELSAIGAPTRNLWLMMTIIYDTLVIGFSVGVWMSANDKKSLQAISILLVIFSIIGLVWGFFAPMHQRGTVELNTETDVLHIAFAMLQLLVMILFIGIGSTAGGKRFKYYSYLSIIAMLVFGAIVTQQINAIASGQKTPWMGLFERVSVYAPIVWIIVFALIIMVKNQFFDISFISRRTDKHISKS